MARVTVRVDLPTGSPDAFLTLMQSVVKKHKADGASSPLDDALVAPLAAVTATAAGQNQDAVEADAKAQASREARNVSMGLGKGQTVGTKGTGLYSVAKIRDRLLDTYEDNPEKLSEYGFEVVVGTAKSPTRAPKPGAADKA